MMPLTLLDYKTGGYRSLEEELQLGAYFGTTHRWDAERQVWVEWTERIEQAGIVHVWEGGCKVETRLDFPDLHTAYQKFLLAKDLFDWMVEKGKVRIPENEAYRVHGRYYPSVTYIIQHIIAKPNLMNWSYEMGVGAGVWAGMVGAPPPDEGVDFQHALEAKARLDAKTLKRTDAEARPWLVLLEWLESCGRSANSRRDGRASQGTSIHKNILFFLQGKTIELSTAPSWLREALLHFMAWSQRVHLKVGYLEQKVMHEELGYAGTADFIGWAELDEKTVSTRAPKEAVKQPVAEEMEAI